jgi:hypothetical protein
MTEDNVLYVEREEFRAEDYLGDAVYAAFNGFMIRLRTGDSQNQVIYLEPAVFRALVEFEKGMRARYLESLPPQPKEQT